jgi:rhodanese-related sulfurtransferase
MEQSSMKKMSPKDFYWFIRESGEHPILLDIREKEAFQQFHIFGAINLPASSTKFEDIHDVSLFSFISFSSWIVCVLKKSVCQTIDLQTIDLRCQEIVQFSLWLLVVKPSCKL